MIESTVGELRSQPGTLTDPVRRWLLEVLHALEHVDEAAATIWSKPLDQGTCLGSVATMYRLLLLAVADGHRRDPWTHLKDLAPAVRSRLSAPKVSSQGGQSWRSPKTH